MRALRSRYHALRYRIAGEHVGENFTVFRSRRARERRVGFYLKGNCHVLTVFACQPLIRRVLNGTCCILKEGNVADSRSDLLLQTLQRLPLDRVRPVLDRLGLPADYFEPRLFEPGIRIDGPGGAETFPKTVVVLSIGSDVMRAVYRHREHAVLLDPGELWVGDAGASALDDLATVQWFRENFISVGRLDVAAFHTNFGRVIRRLAGDTGAHILVFNMLAVEPGSFLHSYRYVREPVARRAREFNLALVDLARSLDFSIIDLNRILKRVGTGRQFDIAHFTPEQSRPIVEEVFRVLMDRLVFTSGAA